MKKKKKRERETKKGTKKREDMLFFSIKIRSIIIWSDFSIVYFSIESKVLTHDINFDFIGIDIGCWTIALINWPLIFETRQTERTKRAIQSDIPISKNESIR